MSSEDVHELCQRFVDAASGYDPYTLGELVAEDVVWHVAGNHALSGDYRGRASLLRHFGRVHDLTGGTLELEPLEIVADGEHAGAFVNVTMTRDGRRIGVLMAQLFRFAPDGTFAEFWAVPNDQTAIDEFWAGVENIGEARG